MRRARSRGCSRPCRRRPRSGAATGSRAAARARPRRSGSCSDRRLLLLDVDDVREVGDRDLRVEQRVDPRRADGEPGRKRHGDVEPVRPAGLVEREAGAAASPGSPGRVERVRRASGAAVEAARVDVSRPWCAGTRFARAIVTSSAPCCVVDADLVGVARARRPATRRRGRAAGRRRAAGRLIGVDRGELHDLRGRGSRAGRGTRGAGITTGQSCCAASPTSRGASRSPG